MGATLTVSFGIRLRGDISYNEFWTTFVSMNKPEQYGIIPMKGYAADEAARMIFREFLRTQDTHLLMLDEDATFAPQTLTRLMSRNLPVVSALVFTKSIPPAPTIWRGASGTTPDGKYITWRTRVDDVAQWFSYDDVWQQIGEMFNQNPNASAIVLNDRDGALSRSDNVGFHCTLIRRDVIEKIGEPFCEGNEQGVHEDFDFSMRAIQAGFDLYVDKTVISGHIGIKPLGAMDFAMWMMAMQMDAQQMKAMEDKHDGKK